MTIPATESSPNDHLPLRWQWSAGEYKLFCLKSQDRTSFTSTKKLRMAIWHTFSNTISTAGLRALSSRSNTEPLMSFLEDSTTGKLVVYRQGAAFSLGRTAQTRRGRHLVYSTRLAGEIEKTHCCLQQPGTTLLLAESSAAPFSFGSCWMCSSYPGWYPRNEVEGVHSSYLSLQILEFSCSLLIKEK